MANIDWKQIWDWADDTGKDVLKIIKPYLPALAKQGPEIWEGFIKHLNDKDFTKIDQMMYQKMSPDERAELEAQVYEGGYQAAMARFKRKELYKEVAQKILLRILLKLATGGLG